MAKADKSNARDVFCVDARNVVLIPETSHPIQAKPSGGRSLNCTPNVLYLQNQARMFENHAHDSRYTGPLTVAQTVSQLFGTGGNNTPLIVEVLR